MTVDPIKWSVTDMNLKVGDEISMRLARWERRKWWQLWKPKWIEHPAETKAYRIVSRTRSTQEGDKG